MALLLAIAPGCLGLTVMHTTPRLPSSTCRRASNILCELRAVRTPSIAIEYCTRCNWMLRSAWLSQELLTTFNGTVSEVRSGSCPPSRFAHPPTAAPVRQVRLQPDHAGGVFRVSVDTAAGESVDVWCRKAEGRFPEAKELKQRVRDVLDPTRSLGHSDKSEDKDYTPVSASCGLSPCCLRPIPRI